VIQFPSTLLVSRKTPEDAAKGDLDLLKKINKSNALTQAANNTLQSQITQLITRGSINGVTPPQAPINYTIYSDGTIEMDGWGYLTGDGSSNLTGNIALPFTLATVECFSAIVVIGQKTSAGAPTSRSQREFGVRCGTNGYLSSTSALNATLAFDTVTVSGDFYMFNWWVKGTQS
jgi:hypothetical protein